jgi:hypothetical protein
MRLPSGGWTFSCLHNHSGLPIEERGKKRTRDLRELWPDHWSEHCASVVPVAVVEREERRTLESMRSELPDVLRAAIEAGRGVVKAPTGVGKSQAMLQIALDRACAGDVVVIASPSRATRDELHDRCLALRASIPMTIAPDVYAMRGREPDNCDAYHMIEPLFRTGGPRAVKSFCGGCVFRERCDFYGQFNRERYRQAGRVVFTTHALTFLTGTPIDQSIDVLVVDEDPTEVIAGQVVATSAHIDRVVGIGAVILDDETRGALGRLMGGGPASSAALAELGPIGVGRDILPEEAGDTPRDAIDALPDFRLPEALALASATDWRGCYIHAGVLTLRAPSLAWPDAGATVVLDASAEQQLTPYLLPGAQWFDLGIPAEVEHVDVIRYPVAAGRHDTIRRPEYAYAIHRAYDGPRTVHVTHKALVTDPAQLGRWDWITGAQGSIDYFKSARESATNEYADAQTIVLDSWHVPNSAVRGRAERIADALPDLAFDDVLRLARRQQEWRSIDQWLGRLRSVNRTERLRVVLIDRRAHWSNVLPDTETVGLLGARLWEQCGALTARPGAIEAFLASKLAQDGAVWIDEDVKPDTVRTPERATLRQATPRHLLRKEYAGRFSELGPVLSGLLGQRVRVCWVRFIRGPSAFRRWYAYVEGSPVYGEMIHRAALIERVDWIEFEGGRYAGPSNLYYQAAQNAAFHLAEGERLTCAAVASEAGRSTRQVERMVRKLGATADSLGKYGPALFKPVCPPDATCGALTGQAVRHEALEYMPIRGWERLELARGPPALP